MDIMIEDRRKVYEKSLYLLYRKNRKKLNTKKIGICSLLLAQDSIYNDTKWLKEFHLFSPPNGLCEEFPYWWKLDDGFVREICLLFCIEMTKDEPETLTYK